MCSRTRANRRARLPATVRLPSAAVGPRRKSSCYADPDNTIGRTTRGLRKCLGHSRGRAGWPKSTSRGGIQSVRVDLPTRIRRGVLHFLLRHWNPNQFAPLAVKALSADLRDVAYRQARRPEAINQIDRRLIVFAGDRLPRRPCKRFAVDDRPHLPVFQLLGLAVKPLEYRRRRGHEVLTRSELPRSAVLINCVDLLYDHAPLILLRIGELDCCLPFTGVAFPIVLGSAYLDAGRRGLTRFVDGARRVVAAISVEVLVRHRGVTAPQRKSLEKDPHDMRVTGVAAARLRFAGSVAHCNCLHVPSPW